MANELCRDAVHIDIRKVNDVPRENAVRLYCYQAGTSWNLQVRGPVRVGGGREGKDFIVATAGLSVEDMKALRDAIDEHLKEM